VLASLAAAAQPQQGFNWINLAILVAVIAVAWPLMQRIRKKARESRRARWAREEAEHEARVREHPEPSDPRKLPGDPD
jgi:hypothetical protein